MRAAVDNQTAFVNGEVEAVVWWTLGRLMVNVPGAGSTGDPDTEAAPRGPFLRKRVVRLPEGLPARDRLTARGTAPDRGGRAVRPHRAVGESPLKTQAPPPVECRTWRESLVAITAHEATHYHQWIDEEVLSEHEAEWAEVHTLALWRERRQP